MYNFKDVKRNSLCQWWVFENIQTKDRAWRNIAQQLREAYRANVQLQVEAENGRLKFEWNIQLSVMQ